MSFHLPQLQLKGHVSSGLPPYISRQILLSPQIKVGEGGVLSNNTGSGIIKIGVRNLGLDKYLTTTKTVSKRPVVSTHGNWLKYLPTYLSLGGFIKYIQVR